jgi:hypothetical protein
MVFGHNSVVAQLEFLSSLMATAGTVTLASAFYPGRLGAGALCTLLFRRNEFTHTRKFQFLAQKKEPRQSCECE